jgi:hypothetical protein
MFLLLLYAAIVFDVFAGEALMLTFGVLFFADISVITTALLKSNKDKRGKPKDAQKQ